MKEALFYVKYPDTHVQCQLCPHRCFIANHSFGKCGVRKNEEGILLALNYGKLSAIQIDPIEKKPLHQFLPKTRILSVGSFGCNMTCGFCQNHDISQHYGRIDANVETQSQVIVDMALDHHLPSIAYTYNEPTVFYEWVIETCRLAKQKGLNNVLVTNGFISSQPFVELAPYVDAMNIDVKTYSEEKYQQLGGHLKPVIATIQRAKEQGIHVEVTCLLVPDLFDDMDKCSLFFEQLYQEIGDTYIHLSRYFPRFHYELPATSIEKMLKLQERALNYFSNVSLGNLS